MHASWLLVVCLVGADPSSWPGFLGAGATPLDSATLPVRWSPSEKLAWTKVLPGYGQSSPVIWNDRVYVTTVDGEQKETLHLVSLDLKSGETVWDKSVESSFTQENSVYVSRAAPTPVVDAKGVYAYFESGDILAWSHAGEALWARSLSKDYGSPENKFGLAASPVQLDDRLIILIDDTKAAYLIALSKATGEILWKTDRSSRSSWSSPSLVDVEGQPQIICSSAGSVDGYDPANGQQLWTKTDVGGNTATTPYRVGPAAFLMAASPGREGENSEKAKESNGLVQIDGTGTESKPRFAWKTATATVSWASPIAHQGHAYWVNRQGVVFCFDLATGETRYSERIKQGPWATPIAAGDRVYFFGKDGLTTVLATGPKYEVLAENELWTESQPPVNNVPQKTEESEDRRRGAAMFSRPTVYGVAAVNGHLIARTGSQVFCIRE